MSAIAKMDKEYKPSSSFITEALRLRFEAGLSYRQIGEQLDVCMSAVHKLIQRFLRANLMWPLDESWTIDKLELALFPSTRPRPDWTDSAPVDDPAL